MLELILALIVLDISGYVFMMCFAFMIACPDGGEDFDFWFYSEPIIKVLAMTDVFALVLYLL